MQAAEALRGSLASGQRSEPECEIAHVLFDVRECPGFRLHALPLGFRHERGRSAASVPVTVGEVVKARLSDPPPEKVAIGVARALEGDNQIEGAAGYQARPSRYDPCALFAGGHADRPFVRMGWEQLDHAGRSRCK
jgi:hypothetical protein